MKRSLKSLLGLQWDQPSDEPAKRLAVLLYEYRVMFLGKTDQRVSWEKAPSRIRIPRQVRFFLQQLIDQEADRERAEAQTAFETALAGPGLCRRKPQAADVKSPRS